VRVSEASFILLYKQKYKKVQNLNELFYLIIPFSVSNQTQLSGFDNNFFTLFQNLLRVGLNTPTNQKYRSDLIILSGLFDIPRKTYFLKEKASFRLSKVHLYRNKK